MVQYISLKYFMAKQMGSDIASNPFLQLYCRNKHNIVKIKC